MVNGIVRIFANFTARRDFSHAYTQLKRFEVLPRQSAGDVNDATITRLGSEGEEFACAAPGK